MTATRKDDGTTGKKGPSLILVKAPGGKNAHQAHGKTSEVTGIA